MRVSLVVPLLNEQASLRALHGAIAEAMAGVQGGWEVVYIDDGSTDGSIDVLREIYEADPRVKVLSFGRNLGKSAALATGFREAAGDLVVTMDADLQDPPELIADMYQKFKEGFDVVYALRTQRKENILKRFLFAAFQVAGDGAVRDPRECGVPGVCGNGGLEWHDRGGKEDGAG